MRFVQKIWQNWKKSVGILFNKFCCPETNFFATTIITIDYQLPIAIIFVQISWLIWDIQEFKFKVNFWQVFWPIVVDGLKSCIWGQKQQNFCRFGPKVHDFCRKMNSLQLCSYKRLAHKAPFGHYKLFTAQISMWG